MYDHKLCEHYAYFNHQDYYNCLLSQVILTCNWIGQNVVRTSVANSAMALSTSFLFSELDFRKKTLGPAPKLLDLVTSTNFLVAKNFRTFGPKNFHLNFPQYKLSTSPSLRCEGKQRWKTIRKKTLNVALL